MIYGYCMAVMQENYFGDDQKFTDMESDIVTSGKKSPQFEHRQPASWPKTGGPDRGSYPAVHPSDDDQFDARHYRPLHVTVDLVVCDVHAHLVKVKCM